VVTLHALHLIEGCDSKEACSWFVADGEAGLELHLVGRRRVQLRCDADGIWRGTQGAFTVELRPEGEIASAAVSPLGAAALLIAGEILGRAGPVPDAIWRDQVVTLATLAALDPALLADLHSSASCPPVDGPRARLARAALERHGALPQGTPAPRAGSGWLAHSGDIDAQTERMPKR